jgi:hypothetical protein
LEGQKPGLRIELEAAILLYTRLSKLAALVTFCNRTLDAKDALDHPSPEMSLREFLRIPCHTALLLS